MVHKDFQVAGKRCYKCNSFWLFGQAPKFSKKL